MTDLHADDTYEGVPARCYRTAEAYDSDWSDKDGGWSCRDVADKVKKYMAIGISGTRQTPHGKVETVHREDRFGAINTVAEICYDNDRVVELVLPDDGYAYFEEKFHVHYMDGPNPSCTDRGRFGCPSNPTSALYRYQQIEKLRQHYQQKKEQQQQQTNACAPPAVGDKKCPFHSRDQ